MCINVLFGMNVGEYPFMTAFVYMLSSPHSDLL